MEYTTISRACPCLFREKRKKFGQWERTARQFSCHAVPDKKALLSAQLRAQLGFEQRKDALHILVGLLAGEAAVVPRSVRLNATDLLPGATPMPR